MAKRIYRASVTPNNWSGTKWEYRLNGRKVSGHKTKAAALKASQRAAHKRAATRGAATSTRIKDAKGRHQDERTLPRKADKYPPRG